MDDALDHYIFEIDSYELFNLLLTGTSASVWKHNWSRDCAALLLENSNWRLTVVRREANVLADKISKNGGFTRLGMGFFPSVTYLHYKLLKSCNFFGLGSRVFVLFFS